MKTFDSTLAAALQLDAISIAFLYEITRVDGNVFYFTTLDRSIVVNGITYNKGAPDLASISIDASTTVGGSQTWGFIDNVIITNEEIDAGVWDYASLKVSIFDWSNPTSVPGLISNFTFGNIIRDKITGVYIVETRQEKQLLQQQYGTVLSRECQYDLGSPQTSQNPRGCGLDLSIYTFTGSVVGVTSKNLFTTTLTQADAYFTGGVLTFTSGQNDGTRLEVKAYLNAGGQITLSLYAAYLPAIGDTFSVYKGCAKTRAACQSFNNMVNFGGHGIYTPSDDALTNYLIG